MKIEVGKFYKLKINGHKLLAIYSDYDPFKFWDYNLSTDIRYHARDIEEWKEPMTKEVWVYLFDSGAIKALFSKFEFEEDERSLRGLIGSRKVTLMEGIWE